jgi:hypothetical protein
MHRSMRFSTFAQSDVAAWQGNRADIWEWHQSSVWNLTVSASARKDGKDGRLRSLHLHGRSRSVARRPDHRSRRLKRSTHTTLSVCWVAR